MSLLDRALVPCALALLATLSSCSTFTDPGPTDTVVFLTQNEDPGVVMEALVDDRVTLDAEGCLRLDSGDRHTVVWPLGFRLEQADDGLIVVDPSGVEVGRVGGSFRLGGGEVAALHDGLPLSDSVRRQAAERCPGRYWIVGEVPRS